jgi:hypothetical protein
MKKYFIIFLLLLITTAKAQRAPFYIVNVAAVKTEREAIKRSKELRNGGYRAGYLWIPNYESLSGAPYYSVYIGPFKSRYDCEVATEQYKKIQSSAYGLLVSHQPQRVQINGIGKVSITQNKKSRSSSKEGW